MEIVSIIGDLAFPIAAFILLYKMVTDELSKLSSTIESNTLVITRLLQYFETKEGHDIDGK